MTAVQQQAATDPDGPTGRLATWVAGLTLDDVPQTVVEREYGGFLSVFGEGHDPDASLLTGQLGQRWDTTIITVKSYAAMGGLHGAIDAARQLRTSVAPEDISKIHITVGETIYKHGWWLPRRPLTSIGAQDEYRVRDRRGAARRQRVA
jgi:hypothetical protein